MSASLRQFLVWILFVRQKVVWEKQLYLSWPPSNRLSQLMVKWASLCCVIQESWRSRFVRNMRGFQSTWITSKLVSSSVGSTSRKISKPSRLIVPTLSLVRLEESLPWPERSRWTWSISSTLSLMSAIKCLSNLVRNCLSVFFPYNSYTKSIEILWNTVKICNKDFSLVFWR